MKALKRALISLVLIGLATPPAKAAVTCEVSTSGAAFGTYDSIGNQDRDTSGTITVSCSGTVGEAVSYTISLSTGGGSYSNRILSGGASTLNYNLYTDISRSQIWGDGANGTSVVSDSYTLNVSPTARNYTVYGRIPSSQVQATAGGYNDTVVITLLY